MFENDGTDDDTVAYLDTNQTSPYHEDFVDTQSVLSTDKLLGMKLQLPHKGEQLEGRVTSRKRDSAGNLIGTSNSNPILDTRQYVVEFGDGAYGDYAANTIIENLHDQFDDYG